MGCTPDRYHAVMAYTQKLPSGKFRGIAKQGRTQLGSKTFAKRADAKAWAERLETAAAGGLDVKAGRARLGKMLPEWLEHRESTVAPKTVKADREMVDALTPGLRQREVSSIKKADVENWLRALHRKGMSHSTVKRRRASLAAFFSWLVEDHRILSNPVSGAVQPARTAEQDEMHPFNEAELGKLVSTIAEKDQRLADIVLVLGWTGLRWGEGRALKVGDVRRDANGSPTHLRIKRSHSEEEEVKTTKGRKNRTVPIVAVITDAIDRLAEGKPRDALLMSAERGGPLWSGRFKEQTDWKTLADERRLYDLRHTAACLWLSKGVDLSTVSSWLGHSNASITNSYLHYLGTSADAAAVARINASFVEA